MTWVERYKGWLIALGVVVVVGAYTAGTYNSLIQADQAVQSQWAQVENVYQRRADLIPNLVRTVKGAANFERQTLESVTTARAAAVSANAAGVQLPVSGEAMARYQRAQDGLSAALTHLFAVAEAYPQLTATENYRDLQSQLEGTENRIAVERMRFNEAAQRFNALRQSFPTNCIASLFGAHFSEKSYFQAQVGASTVPEVQL